MDQLCRLYFAPKEQVRVALIEKLQTLERRLTRCGCFGSSKLGAQSWKLNWQSFNYQLIYGCRVFHILQPVLAQVPNCHAFRQIVNDEFTRRLRQEHLSTMARIADTRSAMHIHADIACRRDQRFACMQAHPHAHMFALWPRAGGE